jgi:competence protein ComEC
VACQSEIRILSGLADQMLGGDRRRAVIQPLVVVLAALCAGFVVDRYAPAVGLSVSVPLLWSASVLVWACWHLAWRAGRRRLRGWLLLLSVLLAAAAWHHCCWRLFSPWDLGFSARIDRRPVCIEGIAVEVPKRIPPGLPNPLQTMKEGPRSSLAVDALSIRDGGGWRVAAGRAMVLVRGDLVGIDAGDRLRIFALLGKPMAARNPGEFDFARHARGGRQLSLLWCKSPDCITICRPAAPWHPGRLIGRLRVRASRALWAKVGDRQQGLAAAVLLGAREQVTDDLKEDFITTGTVHLLVVSGLHLGILAGGLFFALRAGLLPRRSALVLVAVLVIGYTVLTEARPPVVRACVLVVVVCLARLGGRRALAANSLAAAALVVLLFNPADLFRTGPQLSFLAVAALAWFGSYRQQVTPTDPLDQLLAETRSWPIRAMRWARRWGWQLTLVSTVVWLAVAPLVMARFHLCTPIAVLLGPILWLPVAVGLLAGFGVLLLGWLIPPLGHFFGWLCSACLTLVQGCVSLAARLPGGHFWLPGPPDWWLIGLYGGLGLWLLVSRWRPPRRWLLGLLAGWVAVGLLSALFPRPRHARLEVAMLAVGHGGAVVLQLPCGQTVLYDCGHLGSPESATRSIACYLWSRGITRIDVVVLSHADLDHYNALPGLIERFSVGKVVVSSVMFDGDAPGLDYLRQVLAEADVPICQVWSGDRLAAGGGVRMEVLHPPWGGFGGSDNANSVVLLVEFAGHRVLLPGDLEPPGLTMLVAQPGVDCDLVMAPHHGSNRSDPLGFAAWCRPECVVVSGATPAGLSRGVRAYRKLGAAVLHTGQTGAVQVTLSRAGMTLRTYREAR